MMACLSEYIAAELNYSHGPDSKLQVYTNTRGWTAHYIKGKKEKTKDAIYVHLCEVFARWRVVAVENLSKSSSSRSMDTISVLHHMSTAGDGLFIKRDKLQKVSRLVDGLLQYPSVVKETEFLILTTQFRRLLECLSEPNYRNIKYCGKSSGVMPFGVEEFQHIDKCKNKDCKTRLRYMGYCIME